MSEIYKATNVNKGRGHLPKHFITEEVRADARNFIPAAPPGKYEKAQYARERTWKFHGNKNFSQKNMIQKLGVEPDLYQIH